jgi:hypothetical protein
MEASDRHHTSDMTLVAYLAAKHIVHSHMELDGDEVTWYIPLSEALARELDDYREKKALVEPIEFMRQVTRVRRRMFAFIDEERERSAA